MLSIALLSVILSMPARAGNSWPLWDSYAGRFIQPDGRVIDPDRNAMTTSEGQSYALFFALVANDAPAFQKILAWTENNLARGDLSKNLPAWSWGKSSDGGWGVVDSNSASDSDLWTAYSLIQAGILWGKPDYAQKGKDLLLLISRDEVADVPHVGPMLLPGRSGFHESAGEWLLNPSYLPLPLLYAASAADPQGPWKQMAVNLPGWLEKVSRSGFAMDWIKCDPVDCSPAVGPGNSSGTPRGSYDAIRVYLWAGITAEETPGASKLLETFSPMLRYVKTHPLPPESVAATGTILSAAGPVSFAAALIPFAFNAGEYVVTNQLRKEVKVEISKSTGLLGSPARYYDQNLALFALGWQERHFRFAPDGTLRVPWKT